MIKKYKRLPGIFFGWEDEKEERWLEKLSKQGLHFVRYNLLYYVFQVGEPKKYIYKIDYKSTKNTDIDEYLNIFEDAGWEHVGQFAGWHYFRIEKEKADIQDIYTDNNSKIEKYRGYLKTLKIVAACEVPAFLNFTLNPVYGKHSGMNIIKLLLVGLITIFGYTIYKVSKRIKNLSDKIYHD
ncbi:DUF2812 domain-containing protein [Clostridium sp. JNZ J1-5]